MERTLEVVAAMIGEPWNADDLLEPLSKADRAAVRAELLQRAKAKKPEKEIMEVLGQFPDAEVIATLQKVLADKQAGSGPHVRAAVGLKKMGTPAALKALRAHLEHPEDNVAHTVVESYQDEKPATVIKTLLPLVDRFAKRGDDLLMLEVVDRLVAAAPTSKDVIAALARNWKFSVTHDTSLMASNAIFDALVDHAPDSPVAQSAFVEAMGSREEYGQVRGRCALALTGRDTATHVQVLKKMRGLDASSGSFRKDALDQLGKSKKKPAKKRS